MYLIAEIAQAHDGSLGIAHSYIDALSDAGINAIKFQTHIAEAESSEFEPFRVKFSYEDNTRMEYWKRMEFTTEQWAMLKKHCEEKGLEFMSSPFSVAAVDLLEKINVKKYKIGSGELRNFLMLQKIGETRKPIILSSGMSDWKELEETINFLTPFNSELSLMQCTTDYPTKPEQWGLNMIGEMKERFNLPVGFSDHSANIYAGLAATALGAELLEFHVVFDKQMFGPDSKASLTIAEAKQLAEGSRMIERSLQSKYDKQDLSTYRELKTIFGKSLSVNKNLPKGHIITIEDIESKKPGDRGIAASDFKEAIGKVLKINMQKWDFLEDEHLDKFTK